MITLIQGKFSNVTHVHILGIAGTFMGGVAQLAKAKNYQVSGSDQSIYPPMSTQLEKAGIKVSSYSEQTALEPPPDSVIIGNALSRGHPMVEKVLNAQQAYISGPQWLAEHILHDRWVVAVSGTHGKTSTASMVAWILEFAGLNPGFLIGGVAENFGVSARLGKSPFFIVEADEYDTAFFDKRSKFIHYHPRTCVLNNLEFDHADIFDSIKDIQKQFHHLIRTIPGNGLIVMPDDDKYIDEVIKQGCWTPIETQGDSADWRYALKSEDGSEFEVFYKNDKNIPIGCVQWAMTGRHNVRNALSAICAAVHCGVPSKLAVEALNEFKGIQRRMSLVGEVKNIKIYDDFAHHPTAIKTTLEGVKKTIQSLKIQARLIAVFEPRSNTMRLGQHAETLPKAFESANEVFAFIDPKWGWNLDKSKFGSALTVQPSYEGLLDVLVKDLRSNDRVVFMTNGSFGGLPLKLLNALKENR